MDEFEDKKKELLGPVYFEAGAALFDCQTFEYAIGYFLYLLSRLGTKGLDPRRLTAILDGDEKKTAGQLVSTLKAHVQVSKNIEDGLTEALKARNRLVHHFLVENSERFVDSREREKLVAEIRALRSAVRRSQKQLHPFVQHLAENIDGLNIDEMTAEAKKNFLRDS